KNVYLFDSPLHKSAAYSLSKIIYDSYWILPYLRKKIHISIYRRPQQDRAVGPAREVPDRVGAAERVVLLQPQGPQVPDGVQDEPRHHGRLLEGHGPGQVHPHQLPQDRHAKDTRLLPRPRPSRPEVRLDHARVPPRGRRRRPGRHQ
ncbi:hypothetical protein ACJX0J_012016, partial [Zea mays]